MKLKVFVLLKSRFDVEQWKQQFVSGLVPDLTPYGFHHATEYGCEITFSQPTRRSLPARLLNKVLGFDFVHAWRNRRELMGSDVVWTMTEEEYLGALAVISLVNKARPKVVAQTIWLFDKWESISIFRRAALMHLLRKATVFTVHSREYVDLVKQAIPDADVRLHPFGISLDTFPMTEPRSRGHDGPIRIFAAGTDQTRDWATFVEAFGGDARFEVVLVSGSVKEASIEQHDNIQLPRSPTMMEFREYYKWADFVVVPMRPNRYSGITVALEATAMGTAVISSQTGGVPTYFDLNEIAFVEPGNADALREAALHINAPEREQMVHLAQERFRKCGYSTAALAKRYAVLSKNISAMSEPNINASIS